MSAVIRTSPLLRHALLVVFMLCLLALVCGLAQVLSDAFLLLPLSASPLPALDLPPAA